MPRTPALSEPCSPLELTNDHAECGPALANPAPQACPVPPCGSRPAGSSSGTSGLSLQLQGSVPQLLAARSLSSHAQMNNPERAPCPKPGYKPSPGSSHPEEELLHPQTRPGPRGLAGLTPRAWVGLRVPALSSPVMDRCGSPERGHMATTAYGGPSPRAGLSPSVRCPSLRSPTVPSRVELDRPGDPQVLVPLDAF